MKRWHSTAKLFSHATIASVCGFVGYLRISNEHSPPLGDVLAGMSALLIHRGPDDNGTFEDPRFGVAHRRLSILDRSDAGHQPMRLGPITLATNAEFYNHRELAQQHGLNDSLTSRTDTEVILRLIDRHGVEKTLPQVDGMYAFAAWDQAAGILHLVRDPFGVKPLFVLRQPNTIWFASEIKPLLLVPGFERTPSLEALHHYLSFDYIPGQHTAFEGIEEVRPGSHWQVKTANGTVSKSDFSPTQWVTNDDLDGPTAVSESRRLLKNAVERQLQADVDVGVMLSGGLDSSSIAALTREVRGDANFHTFSIGFDDPSFDESQHAEAVAKHLGTHHHHIGISADDMANLLPHYLGSIDEPYADGSAMPTALLSKAAREHVTVLLSGEGGDEMFSGYDTHAAAIARQWYRTVPRWIRQGLVAPAVRSLPVRHRKLSFDFKAKRFVSGAEHSAPHAHYAWREVLSEEAKQTVLQDSVNRSGFPPSHSLFLDAWKRCDSPHDLNRLLHIDRTHHLPDDLMVKNDRMTMAHSIEARVPFCDKDLVAFLATVPPHLLMSGLTPKVLLRTAMKDLLPDSVLKRKKMGLELPYSNWMRGPWRPMVAEILSPARVEATDLLCSAGVTRLLEEHDEMRVDNGRALWGIINFVLWHELYIQTESFRTVSASRPVH
jgi:asparagine synthase (glutamine-hydrolysing)